MGQITIAGQNVNVNSEGYLENMSEWNREIAIELAKQENLELTDKHFEVLEFIRARVEKSEGLTIRAVGKSGIIDIKGFYQLFPGAPLKLATKIAGVPKPTSCV